MSYYITLDQPHRWIRTERKGQVIAHGVVQPADAASLPNKGEKVIGVAQGDHIVVHAIDIPTRRRNKLEAAVPFALEESLTEDIEETHFTILDWKPGEQAKVATTSKQQIAQWQEQMEELGIKLDAIVPEYLLAPQHPQAPVTLIQTDGERIIIRSGKTGGMSLDNETVLYWWNDLEEKDLAIAANNRDLAKSLIQHGGSRVSEWPIGEDIHEWLSESDLDLENANLLHGALAPTHHSEGPSGLKIAAVIAALAIGLKLGADGAEYTQLRNQNKLLKRESTTLIVENFPHITNIVNPKVQLRREFDALGAMSSGGGNFQSLLAAVARVVPRSGGKVEELVYRDNELLVTCNVRDFAGLDSIKKAFEQEAGISTELVSSSANENRVNGRFKLTPGEA